MKTFGQRRPASRSRKPIGFCCYCKRDLAPSTSTSDRAFTFDHINPQDNGGGRKVPCCRKCNTLKGSMPWSEWAWFIDNFPRWWATFNHKNEVVRAIGEERARRARAGEAVIGLQR